MAQLDRLIERLQAGQEVTLESGKPPAIKTAAGSSPVAAQELSRQQVVSLVLETASGPGKEDVSAGQSATFEYQLGGKRFTVEFSASEGKASARVFPAQPPAPAAAPAAAKGPEPEINAMLRAMFALGASDLHLTSAHKPMIRLHGDMKELPDAQVVWQDKMAPLISAIMPPHNAAEFEENKDTDFAYEIGGLARFRVNVFMDRYGMGAVFRQIPIEIVTAEKLKLSKEILDLCFLSKGLVLVTGPTGSGKSTTLCALVDYINRNRRAHIVTIEDPIEFIHNKKNCLINQREVHSHTRSFSAALRAALREDPDIVLVGEMRDLGTISIAIETAETGHLVFGTLHTTTAASTVDRIIDQFPADRQAQIRTMLATSLKGVISQTLCKKTGGGRVAAMETLFVNSAISNLIREGKIYQIPSIIQTGKKQGMVALNDALFKLVVEKAVDPAEAYIKAVDKQGFAALLKSKGIELNMTAMDE
ncbi:MAG: type IV pilus twitching motility protein PilT [Elusimicrobiota bacterium]